MAILQAILDRRSVRAYQAGAAVEEAQVRELLEAAMLAPSACNERPWEFVVVRDRARLEALMKKHRFARMLGTAALAIVVCAAPDPGKPVAYPFFPQDCGAATENILLQAASMGLGTCWCGVYPHEPLILAARAALELPERLIPFNIIAVGVPAERPERRGFYDESKVHAR